MKRTFTEGTAGTQEIVKRLGLSTLWLATVQTLSCLANFAVLICAFGDFSFEWMIYGLGILFPFLWGMGGYWCPEKFLPGDRQQTGLFLLVWTLLPAALCIWAGRGGPEVLRGALFPQLMARLAWFYSLYDGPQSAHVLDTLRPLAAAGTHVLMMAGFAAGLWIREKTQQKK